MPEPGHVRGPMSIEQRRDQMQSDVPYRRHLLERGWMFDSQILAVATNLVDELFPVASRDVLEQPRRGESPLVVDLVEQVASTILKAELDRAAFEDRGSERGQVVAAPHGRQRRKECIR